MPPAREVLPGRVYMITRRCTQRQFLLRPDSATNNAFVYCLAAAAQRSGVLLLFSAAQSNHHHTGIYDPNGTYPDFIEHFHKLLAKCMNSLRGRWENFWSSEQTSVLHLVEPADVFDKMVYALTNPVKDNLVAKVTDWPGFNSFDALVTGKSITAERPGHFFREDGPMPAKVTLTFSRPPGFESMSHEEFSDMLRRRVESAEVDAEAKRPAGVFGRQAVLGQDWRDSPSSREPRRELNPRVAAKNKWGRIEALQRNKAFGNEYRLAFEAFRKGIKNVLFPAGTFWLRRFAAAVCEPWPAASAAAPA
jgi:REP element-mobilizing transposase RayT